MSLLLYCRDVWMAPVNRGTQGTPGALRSLPLIPFSRLTPVRLRAKEVTLSDLLPPAPSVSPCACSQAAAALRDVLSSRHSVDAFAGERFLWCCSKSLSRDDFPSVSLVVSRRRCSTRVQWGRVAVSSFSPSLSAFYTPTQSLFICAMQNVWIQKIRFILIYLKWNILDFWWTVH